MSLGVNQLEWQPAREHTVLERGSHSNTDSSNFRITRDATGL